MPNSPGTLARILTVCTCLTLAGCGGTGSDDRPVTTRTDGGQSTAPSAAAVEQRDNALVRAIHTIPAGATLDVLADDRTVFGGLSYKTVTPYQELNGQRYEFRLLPAGINAADPLAENSQSLDDGEHYTIVVFPGTDDEPAALRVVRDDLDEVEPEQARVRIVHASRDARNIDVWAQGRQEALFAGVEFQTVTDYVAVPPESITLEIRVPNARDPMLTVPDVRFAPGGRYTIVVAGQLRAAPPLEAIVIEDQLGAGGSEGRPAGPNLR